MGGLMVSELGGKEKKFLPLPGVAPRSFNHQLTSACNKQKIIVSEVC
jgi:hypothetical protein